MKVSPTMSSDDNRVGGTGVLES